MLCWQQTRRLTTPPSLPPTTLALQRAVEFHNGGFRCSSGKMPEEVQSIITVVTIVVPTLASNFVVVVQSDEPTSPHITAEPLDRDWVPVSPASALGHRGSEHEAAVVAGRERRLVIALLKVTTRVSLVEHQVSASGPGPRLISCFLRHCLPRINDKYSTIFHIMIRRPPTLHTLPHKYLPCM